MSGRRRRDENPPRVRAWVLSFVAVLILLSIADHLKYFLKTSYSTAEKLGTPSLLYPDDSHDLYVVEEGSQNSHLCVDRFNSINIEATSNPLLISENVTIFLNDNHQFQSRSSWQLCIAQHDHQHGFRIKTYQSSAESNPSLASKIDCDLYLSATVPNPGTENWDWKSNGVGDDSITIYSYAEEFRKSKLRALFISTNEKMNDFRESGSSCVVQLEIFRVSDRDLLHKMSLRGGQVLLPRDLDLLKRSRFSH